ncbi:HNH endonuclease [candidate division KSB1 bacterium]|nr:HNH endonuclease [candidate division KSB1 bacterium]
MSKKRVSTRQKQAVIKRAKGCCEYCRSPMQYAVQTFSIEHIFPQHLGGKSTLDNLALACQGCNNHKYTKTKAPDPASGKFVPLYHPRRQRWHDHFAWIHDFTFIIGMTSTGRATVEALQLNRDGLINIRQLLYETRVHPPK